MGMIMLRHGWIGCELSLSLSLSTIPFSRHDRKPSQPYVTGSEGAWPAMYRWIVCCINNSHVTCQFWWHYDGIVNDPLQLSIMHLILYTSFGRRCDDWQRPIDRRFAADIYIVYQLLHVFEWRVCAGLDSRTRRCVNERRTMNVDAICGATVGDTRREWWSRDILMDYGYAMLWCVGLGRIARWFDECMIGALADVEYWLRSWFNLIS